MESKENTAVIIMPYSFYKYDIIAELARMGYSENNIAVANDFLSIYSWVMDNKTIVPYLGFFISGLCTLKCKHCIANVPYFKTRCKIRDFNEIKKDIDAAFNVIDFVNLLALSTGETIIHPELEKILAYIHNNYSHKYYRLQTVTNGTVVPPAKTFAALGKYKCKLNISDYSYIIPEKLRTKELIEMCKKHAIEYRLVDVLPGGENQTPKWSDLGDFFIDHGRNNIENLSMYKMCSSLSCKTVYKERLYLCARSAWGEFGALYTPNADSDFIDLNHVTKKKFVNFYNGLSGFPAVCKRCDGVGPYVNKNVVDAGVQLSCKDIVIKQGEQL